MVARCSLLSCYLWALSDLVTFFDSTFAAELPDRLPSPFATTPHSIAAHAARILQEELRSGVHDGLGQDFAREREGKMLGVLVVRDSRTRLGFLRAGSGMLGGSWRPSGFAPPLFDDEARSAFWPRGQRQLEAITAQIADLETSEEAQGLAVRLVVLSELHTHAEEELRLAHKESKAKRAARRGAGDVSKEELLALSRESQDDRRAGKAMRAAHKMELDALLEVQNALQECVRGLEDRRTALSNALLAKIQSGYIIRNAKGETRSLASFYEGDAPGGSGDCAGPKLLNYAYEHALEPIAFAEFWWGAPPVGGGRHSGQFYPACRGKCGPLMPFMLQGLDVEAAPSFGSVTEKPSPPPVIYEDDHIFAVHKPESLLSVPGRTAELRDSALARLRDAHEGADKPMQIHRLDRDTSGVMVFAKHRDAHREMQALFAERSMQKRYVAWVEGEDVPERGRISLPLRVDLEDRPRQVVDEERGKEAITEFEVLERYKGLVKVAFMPATGRTHQLRVHAAHSNGLGAPILGDRLYGRPASRLFLHASELAFRHPQRGDEIVIQCPEGPEFDAAAKQLADDPS